MTISDNNGSVAAFAEIAAKFCAWCEGPIGDDRDEMHTAAALLAGLHMIAFLPAVEADGDTLDQSSKEDWQAVRDRFQCLPVRGFWSVYDPTKAGEGETVFGDLADDFAWIYAGLKDGLILFQSGFVDDAVGEWKWQYHNAWGHNLLCAQQCVWSWIRNNAPLG